jgi:hypothetical protein
MAGRYTYHCDVCGVEKGEVNHWWIATPSLAQPEENIVAVFIVWPWDDKMASSESHQHDKHLCGAACVATAQSQWMAEVSAITAKHQPKPAGELRPAQEITAL